MAGILKLSVTMAVVSGLAGIVVTGAPVQAETLTIGAAHSLKAVFQEIVPMFEKEHGAKVGVVYGPSHTLRRQIEKGAAIDVFLPGAVEEVQKLQKNGLTLNGGPRIYAQTSLVLVMSATSRTTPISFRDVLLNRVTRIAVGNPKTSALGEITSRALTKFHPGYNHRFNVLPAEHSEDIVDLIQTGEADVGVVYRVDAINSGQVRIIDEAPTGTFTPVQFGEAVVWTCREASLSVAGEFLDFMMSPRIQKLLLKYGFDSVPSNGSLARVRSIEHEP
jgi:molybdate transport system substrate-binding protein